MHGWQTLDCLDLWPGDEVWHAESFSLIGHVNDQGVFVCHLGQMH